MTDKKEIKPKHEQWLDDWINDEANGMKDAIFYTEEDVVQIINDFDSENEDWGFH